jgi:hypothetical protein
MEKKKLLPYGISDFEAITKENLYYVDKTMFIPTLEKTKYNFLLRPRRFGKSMLASTLDTYYDIGKSHRFQEFYKGTWISENPTELQGKYLTLVFNFSGGIYERGIYQATFNNSCNFAISGFIDKYKGILPKSTINNMEKTNNASEKLLALGYGLYNTDLKLYIFVDEYDNFTNTLLTDFGTDEYNEIVHQNGFYKQFFKTLKHLTTGSDSALGRALITGVSPVTMDDMGSGFNIGYNLSLLPSLNTLFGFTEREVCDMLKYYEIPQDDVLSLMKEWYDNYRFSDKVEQSVFNTDAVLYFVKEYYEFKEIPRFLIDDNLKMDYVKLKNLVVQGRQINGNFKVLTHIINTGGIVSEIVKSFPSDLVAKENNYISLLYFLGLITHSGALIEDKPFLKIPNQAIKTIFFEYIKLVIEESHNFTINTFEFSNMLSDMAYKGKFKPMFNFIASEINKNTSVRDFINKSNNEQVVKLFYLKDLMLFDTYIVHSEHENNKGFSDLVLNPFIDRYKNIKYAYIIEFKYIKRGVKKLDLKATIQKNVEQAFKQLNKYAIDDKLKKMLHLKPYGNITLKKVVVVFHGWEVVYCEEYK